MPLGPEETKHLAIAAVIGAVAGAVGVAVLSRTPSQSRRSSCTLCLENSSPKHIPEGHRLLPGAGDGESSVAVYASDTSRALDELTKRMESLEKAVRSRLMSRSGTNSSVAGYLTAPESPSEEEEDFQDVGEESSGGEDIFFHSSATPKRAKPKQVTEPSEQAPAEGILTHKSTVVTADYTEIDRCLCSDISEDNIKAHTLLSDLRQNNLTLDTDAQFLWRFAKSVHQKTLSASDVEVKKVHAFRAKELAFQALGSSSGDAIPDVHKWCAITIGNIGDYVSLAEKISNGSVFKERIDSAIRLNNKDEMSYYLLGRWCYSVYMMTWVERKVATSYCSDFPSTTIDEALVAFKNSEALKPGHWIDNQLYLAKCYIEKREYSAAMMWLDKAMTLPTKHEDMESKQETEKLIGKYSYYRQSI